MILYNGVTSINTSQNVCQIGNYGPNCEYLCSFGCPTPYCDKITGNCRVGVNICALGHHGAKCERCPIGTHGHVCSERCSPYCGGSNKDCEVRSGICLFGCVDGYYMPDCSIVCPVYTYGQRCLKSCSLNCAGPNGTCNNINGTCDSGCISGYQEPLCDTKCTGNTYGAGYEGDKCDREQMIWKKYGEVYIPLAIVSSVVFFLFILSLLLSPVSDSFSFPERNDAEFAGMVAPLSDLPSPEETSLEERAPSSGT
ncbi:hypothetical protein RRG08_048931 [Elysia crispata]|uniref:Uncharacterized protein n=1 Tax=Elysia crispata TaxID=231223 RepID=A0AAE0YNU3_9GAST|nr:hypothetical protein RRG08_048931 [Elysia crispata]